MLMWLALAAHAALGCEVRPVATVKLDASSTNLVVPVSIDGTTVPMILDTGAERSMLDLDTVQRLRIARDEWVATTMRGVGGVERQRNALPQSVMLGGIALHARSVAPGLSLPVGHLPFGAQGGVPIAGLLGTDLLAGFDLMLDGPANRLTLYDVQGCAGRFLPWTRPYDAIPTIRPVRDTLLVPVRLDGRVLLGEIDTGSASTMVLAPGMQKLGLTEAMLDDDQAVLTHGVGPDALTVRRHRFGAMAVGTETEANPVLWVGSARALRIVDMLLGVAWLRTRVVWLSYATTQVFLARP